MADRYYIPKSQADLIHHTLIKATGILKSARLVRGDAGDGKTTTDFAGAIADAIPHVDPYKGANRGRNILDEDVIISAGYAKVVFGYINRKLANCGYDNVHNYNASGDVNKNDMIKFLKMCAKEVSE